MKQIVIAQRGWVFVGDVERSGDDVVIHNAMNIRRWGTNRGLGELALNGPRRETELDNYGTVRMHMLAVVGAIDCEASKWTAPLIDSESSAVGYGYGYGYGDGYGDGDGDGDGDGYGYGF